VKAGNSNSPDHVIVKCPTCEADVQWGQQSPFRPFCSSPCRDKDFIGWANEEKMISGSSVYDDILSDDLNDA
jgi:endogenous inhibitor of DNA gyrase (YacG/DUF329 family)